jgi:UrcA family protein
MRNHSLRNALIAAGALALSAVSVHAQDGSYNDDAAYRNAPDDTIEIIQHHYAPGRSELGTPYKLVSLSKPVRIDDLDLRTRRGVRILRNRIRLTARLLCRDLDERYPVTADNSPPCYSNAMQDAMYRANLAIADARGYND